MILSDVDLELRSSYNKRWPLLNLKCGCHGAKDARANARQLADGKREEQWEEEITSLQTSC
jgi:hypothetical protein